jgi:hypothetical protein
MYKNIPHHYLHHKNGMPILPSASINRNTYAVTCGQDWFQLFFNNSKMMFC